MKMSVLAATAAAVAIALAGCADPANLSWPQNGVLQSGAALPSGLLPSGKGVPVGIYERGFPQEPVLIHAFSAASGVRPRLTVYYSGWGEPFWVSFADATHTSGAVPVVQLQPDGVKLATITSGQWDRYLKSYAAAVKEFKYPVILSFGHEMNGTWYSWGSGHESPRGFVNAWRHVVTIFRQAGAANVRWMWTITTVTNSGPWIGEWWPGIEWVNFIGVDGYYYYSSSTFTTVFGQTLTDIRQFTKAPVVISEVGIGINANRDKQISGLFAGARVNRIGGIIWFDVSQNDGIYHQDWRLEGDKSALSAFRAGASGE